MDNNKKIPLIDFSIDMKNILSKAIGEERARFFVNHMVKFVYEVKEDVEECSAWRDEGIYNDDDVRLAIGRILFDYLHIEY